jgi:XTP/dITP diphosphohydrolase
MRLGFITSNEGKFREMNTALSPLGHEVMQLNMEYPELQADSILEVARFGLDWIKDLIKKENNDSIEQNIQKMDAIIIEDSGIFVHSLKDFPGVYSKFVFKTIGYLGIIHLMKEHEDRSATFRSCIALNNLNNNSNQFFEGICKGTIVSKPKGKKGFGYDPIFQAEGASKTFAEMDPPEKNKYSHRGKAMDQLIDFFRKQ